jgi:hypothetical protein
MQLKARIAKLRIAISKASLSSSFVSVAAFARSWLSLITAAAVTIW